MPSRSDLDGDGWRWNLDPNDRDPNIIGERPYGTPISNDSGPTVEWPTPNPVWTPYSGTTVEWAAPNPGLSTPGGWSPSSDYEEPNYGYQTPATPINGVYGYNPIVQTPGMWEPGSNEEIDPYLPNPDWTESQWNNWLNEPTITLTPGYTDPSYDNFIAGIPTSQLNPPAFNPSYDPGTQLTQPINYSPDVPFYPFDPNQTNAVSPVIPPIPDDYWDQSQFATPIVDRPGINDPDHNGQDGLFANLLSGKITYL